MMINEKHPHFFTDGAPAHFKNHSNIYNLIHHKEDFDIEASWRFSASGHRKGSCDGLDTTVKSTATRWVLASDKGFSSVTDFCNFTKKFNDDVTRANNSAEIPIHVLYLESSVVECTLQGFLTKR